MDYIEQDDGLVLITGYIDNSYSITVTKEEADRIRAAEDLLTELDARQYK